MTGGAARGFVLTPTFRVRGGRVAVHLYAVLDDGTPALVTDDRLLPYCFVRTADAAGVDAVIVPAPSDARGTDLHNPNVIRASLGAYFTVPTVAAGIGETIDWLRDRDITVVAATPDAAVARATALPGFAPVVVAGSLYLVGAVRGALTGEAADA